ncbi:6-phosphogluconolactonase [Jannaschia sp. Os4]|uniref:6-phosphogluconolactonase n=1 Tax=Jannaschia sp. Os4 TaxID=2807617 RepID=UPI00193A8284|nr:6-phosphogluconolactonase [Jannaschia sp. Os4]MBM2576558.1 6-phosphogluconolactonase [Jannaschia sp. Os4]
MKLRTYPDREMQAMALADVLASALKNCLLVHDHASFCVPGGSTPGETFALLADADLEWERVHVFLNDERWVPEDHARSNTKLLRETLLTGRAAAATLVPMVNDAPTPKEGASRLAAGLDGELPISLLLLGMGGDMHTASLFPGEPATKAALADDAPRLMGVHPEGQEPRITLTAPVLKGAMETHVLITGDEKRAALERAQGMDPLDAPIAAFLRNAEVHWAP